MDKAQREKLEAKGWKVGSVADFLGLTPEEMALIDIKLALSRTLRHRRQERMTQAELADKIHSSQPRIAKAEGGDSSVSMELLVRAILATGATLNEIAQVIASVGGPAAQPLTPTGSSAGKKYIRILPPKRRANGVGSSYRAANSRRHTSAANSRRDR
jgi:transcriptional regulator with XRE-family HTH domain